MSAGLVRFHEAHVAEFVAEDTQDAATIAAANSRLRDRQEKRQAAERDVRIAAQRAKAQALAEEVARRTAEVAERAERWRMAADVFAPLVAELLASEIALDRVYERRVKFARTLRERPPKRPGVGVAREILSQMDLSLRAEKARR